MRFLVSFGFFSKYFVNDFLLLLFYLIDNNNYGVILVIWFAIAFNAVLILALVWFWWIIIRLFIDKNYRDCPPYVPSFGQEKNAIISEVSKILVNSNKQMTILDPGCGSGSLLIALAKKFPQHKFIGIEWSRLTYLIVKHRCRNIKNITLFNDDMFNHSFSSADIIVCFLMQPLMKKFGDKLKIEAKEGLVVYSNSFYIPELEASEKIETKGIGFIKNVYIYRF